jgi:hypothetical protein
MKSLWLPSDAWSFAFQILIGIGSVALSPAVWAQEDQAIAGSPQVAWSNIQQLLEKLETAVQSRDLPGVHAPGMKIRAHFKTLDPNRDTLAGDESQKLTARLHQLDSSITDLHSATDAANQKQAESALKEVEAALDQLKAQEAEVAFKTMP